MTLYLETSFAFTYLARQEKSLATVIDRSKRIVTSILTIMEIRRGLIRLEQMREITAGERQRVTAALADISADWTIFEIEPGIQKRAMESFPIEPVRTLDAIHLATALEFVRIYPDLAVATLDKRIIQNLAPLGIPVI